MAKRNTAAFKRFMGKVLVPVELAERRAVRPPPVNVEWLPAPTPGSIAAYSEELLLCMLAVMLREAGIGLSPPGTIVAHLLARHEHSGRTGR